MPRILTLDSHQPQFVSRRLRSGATLVNNAVTVTVAALSSTTDGVVACDIYICREAQQFQGLGLGKITMYCKPNVRILGYVSVVSRNPDDRT